MAKRSKKTRKGTRRATPMEMLQAAVFIIRDTGRSPPANCLIGETPADTIQTCANVITNAASHARGSIVICDPNVLYSVVHALVHAKREAQSLWDAAKCVTEAANE